MGSGKMILLDAASGLVPGVDWERTRSPVGQPFVRPSRAIPVFAQNADGLDGVHAVGSSTIRDDLFFLWNLCQAALELRDGNRERSRNVSRAKLLLRAYVDDGDVARSHSTLQLAETHRFQLISAVDVELCHLLDFRESATGEALELAQELEDVLARQPVMDVGGIPPSVDETRLS